MTFRHDDHSDRFRNTIENKPPDGVCCRNTAREYSDTDEKYGAEKASQPRVDYFNFSDRLSSKRKRIAPDIQSDASIRSEKGRVSVTWLPRQEP